MNKRKKYRDRLPEDYYAATLQEIADELGLSHQRVDQILRQALEKVRKRLISQGIQEEDIP